MARTAAFYTDAALNAFNAGFTSKAGQKDAMQDINRAYDIYRRVFAEACLAAMRTGNGEMTPEVNTVYWDVPSYPHLWKPKHAEMVRTAFGDTLNETIDAIEKLAELRATIKNAPVNAPVRKEVSPYEIKARELLTDLMERRKTQYLEAIDLGEIFGYLPVYANTHWCINEHGTRYLRTFWYLRGKMTPLNIIICAAEELERREKEAA